MNWTLIAGIIAILMAVGWAASWATLRDMLSHAQKVKQEYDAAMADGNISDADVQIILPDLVGCIEDAVHIWQTFSNLVVKIAGLFMAKKA